MRAAVEAAVVTARLGQEADPTVPPPRPLAPFLSFTRLPDRALAAARKVLDDDDDFRQRVRDATSEESVGPASWLFLDRPEGWAEELSRLAVAAEEAADAAEETKVETALRRRVAATESSLDEARRELARLRAELAETKDQLASERRARRVVESDAGRVRRKSVGRESEMEELRRHLSELQEELDQIDRSAPPPAREEEVDDEPQAPPPPVVDHGALAALLAEGGRAAAALSEALAEAERLVAPALETAPDEPLAGVRPPGRGFPSMGLERRRPTALPPGMLDDSVEAADHLVRTRGARVLVDGYNVTKSARPELVLAEQRRWLADAAVELAARTGARVELVFDGAADQASAPAELGRRQGVQVRFSAEGVEADDVLLELVEELPVTVPVVVSSDDRRVRDGARRRGANVVSVSQLLMVLGRPLS